MDLEIEQKTGDSVIDLSLDTIKKKKQALVFVNTKRSAEKQAEDIAKKLETNRVLHELSERILNVLPKPTKQCERLSRCVKKGTAFHHAGLTQKQREMIEDNFRKGVIKIICCTPTLAAGVDLPAFRAVLKDMKRYGGKFGMNYIPVLEYLQMAGRAGRPRFDKFGEAVIIAKTDSEKEELYERYVKGEPEEVYSKLAVEPVLRTSVLSLIATEFVRSKKEIMDFFGKTFWAYQFEDMAELENKVNNMLGMLEDWGFIKSKSGGSDFVSASEISDDSYNATLLGKRISQLYIDPLTAHKLILSLQKAMSLKKLESFSFLQMISSSLEIRPRLRAKSKEFDMICEKIAEYEPYLLENEPSVYEPEHEDYLDSIKTAMMFEEWIEEKTDEYLLEEYSIRPGEIRVKLSVGDWLLYCSEEIARILQLKKVISEIRKTRYRLKYGVKEELLPLLKLKGVGRMRARNLFKNRMKTVEDVRKASFADVAKILGPKIAFSVKEQLGEKIRKEDLKIPKGRRKGQLSLEKFSSHR